MAYLIIYGYKLGVLGASQIKHHDEQQGRSTCAHPDVGVGGQSPAWVPGYETRVWFRRLKTGAIPHLKGLQAKRHKHFGLLGESPKEDVLACDCGLGTQDSVHFWEEFVFTAGLRAEVVGKTGTLVEGTGPARDRLWRGALSVVNSKTDNPVKSVFWPLARLNRPR